MRRANPSGEARSIGSVWDLRRELAGEVGDRAIEVSGIHLREDRPQDAGCRPPDTHDEGNPSCPVGPPLEAVVVQDGQREECPFPGPPVRRIEAHHAKGCRGRAPQVDLTSGRRAEGAGWIELDPADVWRPARPVGDAREMVPRDYRADVGDERPLKVGPHVDLPANRSAHKWWDIRARTLTTVDISTTDIYGQDRSVSSSGSCIAPPRRACPGRPLCPDL